MATSGEPTEPREERLSAEELPPRIGRYDVRGLLGAGGMGKVYEVFDDALGRRLAAKRLNESLSSEARGRFVREARIVGRLEHPNIVPIHELGRTVDGELFFTMKRVEGQTLAARIAAAAAGVEPLTLAFALRVIGQITDALGYAHDHGVIHRDLKPSNIMLAPFGVVLVMDWGLACQIGRGPEPIDAPDLQVFPEALSAVSATLDGKILGTPGYMSPEQAKGQLSDLDARCDVFAMGAILYEMLTLTPPFDNPEQAQRLARTIRGDWVPPRALATERNIPWELEAIVVRAMSTRPDDRYPDGAALATELLRFAENRTLAAVRYSPWQRVAKWARRRRASLVAAAGLLTAVAVGGVAISIDVARRRDFATYAAQARKAHEIQAWAPALRAAERALALRPDAGMDRVADASRRAIATQRRRSQLRVSIDPLDRLVEETRPYFYIRGFDVERRLRKVRGALDRVAALTTDPGLSAEPELWAAIGKARYFVGDLDLAQTALERALALGTTDGPALFNLARILVFKLRFSHRPGGSPEARKERDRIARLAKRCLDRVSSTATALPLLDAQLSRVWRTLASGETNTALGLSAQGTTVFRGQLGVEGFWLVRGMVLASPPEALAALDRAVTFRPHYPLALIARGVRYMRVGRVDDALAELNGVLKTLPGHSAALQHRAAARLQLGDVAGALTDLSAAASLAPTADLHCQRAAALSRLGRHAEALNALDRAAKLDLGDALVWAQRAAIQAASGDVRSALESCDKAVALDPERGGVFARRAQVRLALGQLDMAADDATRALELDPTDMDSLALRGSVRTRQGRQDEALRDFEYVVGQRPAWRDWARYGACLHALGRDPEARTAYERALRNAPESARNALRKALAQLRK